MPKYDLTTAANLQDEASFVSAYNANLVKIETALDAVLFRTGDGAASDNAMITDLDMNSQRILNLPAPSVATEAARHGDLQTYVTDAETAKTAAETAQTAAETAKTAAELAETNAETAETSAQAILTEIETYDINTGVSTPVPVGEKNTGTYTPEPSDGVLLTGTNGGAFILAAPTGTGWYRLMLINTATAGAITASGWDITLDSDATLSHTVDGSVVELMAVNDGVKKVLQVKLLLDATP